MNINKILTISIIVIVLVLGSLVGLLVFRKNKQVQQIATDGAQQVVTTAPVIIPDSDKEQLQQFAKDNPAAAVEGVRSPTPMPPNAFTLTDGEIMPRILPAKGNNVTIINKRNTAFEIWVRTPTEKEKNTGIQVLANATTTLDISQYKRNVTILFIAPGTSAESVSPINIAEIAILN